MPMAMAMASSSSQPLHSLAAAAFPFPCITKLTVTPPPTASASASATSLPLSLRMRTDKKTSSFKQKQRLSLSPFVFPETKTETDTQTMDANFDWYAHWYPVTPVCDLDKRVPLPKRVLGIDLVVWWDRNANSWNVFDDACPHRLAPLSEGRIDRLGRLQCVYHGWCFDGAGHCKLIPQAPADGPPVHTFERACATVYPSTVQNGIVWFWPNANDETIHSKKPPYVPEIDDPSYTSLMAIRDLPYGYEVLTENVMDPAHVPYAHYGIMRPQRTKNPVDREGGVPLDLAVPTIEPAGFVTYRDPGSNRFFAPCVYFSSFPLGRNRANGGATSEETKMMPEEKRMLAMVFFCIPVSPGRSRIIWTFPRNFGVWIDKVIPRWMFHIGQNLIFDSDLHLLHLEERKIREAGGSEEWQKSCFVPTKSDANVVAFRKWLTKYAGGQVDWRGKFTGALPPTPPREQLFDRYWSHVVNCSSCKGAYKGLNVLETVLQVISISLLGIVAATRQAIPSMVAKTAMVSMAILCFAASKWLAYFIRKVFHFHDYNHALR